MNLNKISIALLSSGLISLTANATNGYFSHGYTAQEKGMGGAGVALATSSLTSATNPANLVNVDEQMSVGFSLFSPIRSYTVSGAPSIPAGTTPVIGNIPSCQAPGIEPCQIPFSINEQTIESARNLFLIPNFGYVTKHGENMAFGVALYGNGGMNSEYKGGSARLYDPQSDSIVESAGTFGNGITGVDLSQLFINTSVAYRANNQLSLGGSVIFAIQSFAATGIAPFANVSLDPSKLTNNGHDYAYGAGIKLGLTHSFNDDLSIGLSYQSKIRMTEFEDYAGLFANNGRVDIPSTYTIGFAWNTSDTAKLLLDYQKLNYTDSAAISNPISSILAGGNCADALNNSINNNAPSLATGNGCLGGANGAGFGWADISVYKVGYQWQSGDDTFRIGYSTTSHPIAPSEVNINLLSPGIMEDHFTVGYTMATKENEWTFFLMYAPEVELSGPSQFDPAQTISFKMYQVEFGLDYRF